MYSLVYIGKWVWYDRTIGMPSILAVRRAAKTINPGEVQCMMSGRNRLIVFQTSL
jgi:hypothetical protein